MIREEKNVQFQISTLIIFLTISWLSLLLVNVFVALKFYSINLLCMLLAQLISFYAHGLQLCPIFDVSWEWNSLAKVNICSLLLIWLSLDNSFVQWIQLQALLFWVTWSKTINLFCLVMNDFNHFYFNGQNSKLK